MDLLLLIGVIALCATVMEARRSKCFIAKDVCPCEHMKFWLISKRTDKDGIEVTEENVHEMPFVFGPLKIIIHGYKGQKYYKPNDLLVPTYMEMWDYNILIVDWGKMAKNGCYLYALFNTHIAGKCTASLLKKFYEKRGKRWEQAIHVIGYSIGAHVAGILGYHLPNITRITGLDPGFALPGFNKNTSHPIYKLSPSAAKFVDVYHSNSGLIGRTVKPLGHADFYINNGRAQPGCRITSCNQYRSVEVFAESITQPDAFFGKPCATNALYYKLGVLNEVCPYTGNNTLVKAGEFVEKDARGQFKFETNTEKPFGKGRGPRKLYPTKEDLQ